AVVQGDGGAEAGGIVLLEKEERGAGDDAVALCQNPLADRHAGDEGAVATVEVAPEEPAVLRLADAMLAGDGEIAQMHRAGAVPADRQGLGTQKEGSPCQGAADGGEFRAHEALSNPESLSETEVPFAPTEVLSPGVICLADHV